MQKRPQTIPRIDAEYKILGTNIKYKMQGEKREEWLNEKCAEQIKNIDTADMHKRIKEIAEQKTCFLTVHEI